MGAVWNKMPGSSWQDEVVMHESAFSVFVRRSDEAVVCLALVGELDLATTSILEAALEDAERTSQTVLILDLGALSYVDSSGLHCLFDAHKRAYAAGRRMVLHAPGGAPRRMLQITGLDGQLDLVSTVALNELVRADEMPPGQRPIDAVNVGMDT